MNIIPALLEKTFEDIRERLSRLDSSGQIVQIDIADNTLTNSSTFLDVDRLQEIHNHKFEIHFMVKDPESILKRKIPNVESIILHTQLDRPLNEELTYYKRLGYKVGISINPEESIEIIEGISHILDKAQFMTVIPGKQGSTFIPEVLDKIMEFNNIYSSIKTQVDGGIKKEHLPSLLKLGIDNVVMGSYIFGSENPKDTLSSLKESTMDEITSLMGTDRKIKKVSFLGGASWGETDQPYIDSFNTAKLLAENGYEIMNGGGPGVMRASTKGGHAGGAKVLAITYHPNKVKKNYEGVDKENDFDEEIITLDYFDRTKVMLQNSDLHIVFRGSTGTISEFGMTWASSRIHEGNHKPIILFGDFWEEILDVLKKNLLMRTGEIELLKICKTPEEVLEYTKSLEE